MDVFGSKVAQIHVQREQALEELRPGPSMRTALTGHVKRGFERQPDGKNAVKKRKPSSGSSTNKPKSKRQRTE